MPLKDGLQQGIFTLKIVVDQSLGYLGFCGQIFDADVFDTSVGI